MNTKKNLIKQFCKVISLIFIASGIWGCASAIRNTAEYGVPALKAASGAAKAARPISPSEEYYLGRTVCARFIDMYPILENEKATNYISLLGHALAMHSKTPETFGGYHFAILDTEAPNAFACPGGTILISKGLIKQTKNEDELAAVLAHELSHIHFRDGISAIKSSRWTKALTLIGTVAAEKYGSKEFGKLVNLFEGSVEDVMEGLIVKGYSRKQELEADKTAVAILTKTGYDPSAMEKLLTRLMAANKEKVEKGLMTTHPASSKRIESVKKETTSIKYVENKPTGTREKRFIQFINSI